MFLKHQAFVGYFTKSAAQLCSAGLPRAAVPTRFWLSKCSGPSRGGASERLRLLRMTITGESRFPAGLDLVLGLPRAYALGSFMPPLLGWILAVLSPFAALEWHGDRWSRFTFPTFRTERGRWGTLHSWLFWHFTAWFAPPGLVLWPCSWKSRLATRLRAKV